MYIVERSARVAHSAADMYALVNDVDSYAAFLPWCDGARVLERSAHEMVAEVCIAFRGLHKSFTTRNRLTANEQIDITLLDGPFSELRGTWRFCPQPDGGSTIALTLHFDFANALVGRVAGPVFRHIADSMVDSFVQRAHEVCT